MNQKSVIITRITIFFIGLVATFKVIYSQFSLPNTLYLIPLVYSTLIIVFPSMTKYMYNYLGNLALNLVMFLRYVVSPLLISTNDIYLIRGIYPLEKSYEVAIILMLYEMIMVFLVFFLFHKKFYALTEFKSDVVILKKNFVPWIYIGFCMILVALYPQILSRYEFILTAKELKSKVLEIEILSIIPLLVQLGTLIITILLVNNLFIKYSKRKRVIYTLLALSIILIMSSFIIGTSRFSVVLPMITGFYMVYYLFRRHRKYITVISVGIMFFVIILTSLLKESTIASQTVNFSDFITEISSDLQSYFSGVTNVAIAVQTTDIYNSFNFESIVADLTKSVVFVNSFFSSSNSAFNDFNIVFYNGGIAKDQILPMIGQGYLYFGIILAPIFSIITLITLMYLDSKVVRSKSVPFKYIYIYFTLKTGLFMMTNFTNLLSFFTNFFCILFAIFLINSRLMKNEKEVIL